MQMTRSERLLHMSVLLGLAAVVLWTPLTWAHEIEVTFGGVKQTITSTPHKPYLVIGSIRELRQHYGEIKDVLPPMPFMMEGQWILPAGRGFRTFPHKDGYIETFSENCRYVVRCREAPVWMGRMKHCKEITVQRVGGPVLWQADEGPIYPKVTNEGHVIGTIGPMDGPLHLTIQARDGSLVASVKEPLVLGPGWWSVLPVNRERVVIAWSMHRLLAVDYDGCVRWRRQLSPVPGAYPFPVFADAALDPLGRGLCVISKDIDKLDQLEVVELQTGKQRQVLAEGAVRLPSAFSPSGRYAVAWDSGDLVALDWASGTPLFRIADFAVTDRPPEARLRGGYFAVSDAPVHLVVRRDHNITTTAVVNQDLTAVWRCRTSLDMVRHIVSADATELNIVSVSFDGSETYGMLLYRLPRQPN